ncbi:ABC transporter substrate-binding protein [Candidatus Methylobacter oryzae]|uniref:ABC transporter substrate-binding protein n=1 Tax=Candidatus Methylobacter oryzae TaxID=2497749 RepID=UPI001F4FAD88|nr:ABC transporter substrate-binding protein [Candidatus Methylobacter oryzae]
MPKRLIQTLAIAWLLLGASTAGADELDPVTLQLKWKHQFQFAGYYAAKEKGFYRDAGLDVNIVEAAPGVDPAQEVIAGRAQFGVGTSELILNRYRGDPVVVLGVIFQHSPLSLIALSDSGIDNIHKLIGRKVMIEPSSAELFAYLLQEGFTSKAFDLQHHSLDLNDLLSGKIDAMSVYVTDELYMLKQQKRTYIQFSPRMSGIDFYGDNFFTLETELDQNPQRVKAFREASLRGWRYAMQNPDEIVQLIYDRYSQRHSIEHLQFEAKAMHDLMQPELIDPGYMNIGRWQHIAQTYRQLGLLPERFDVEAMLHFPNSAIDLKKLKIKLYYAAAGLSLLALLSVILFRFYRAARINEARLNTMFNHAPLSLIVLDDQNRIQNWNAEAEKTFLWRAEDILGKDISTIIPPADHQEVEEVLAAVHKKRAISHTENSNIKKDGSEILCEWLNAPFKDKHDQANFIICMARDITEQTRLKQKLEQAAHYDNLTKLPNRALILDLLKQSIATAARQKTKLAILFLDLNGFKAINDRLGHESGDRLLLTVAERLPQAIRECDYAGRLAGDEFLVILQDIGSLQNAQKVAGKLQGLISQPCMLKDQAVAISASIGISLYPDDAIEINELIHHADQAMYQVKQVSRSDKHSSAV